MLGLNVFTHVSQLNRVDPRLSSLLANCRPGDKLQMPFNNERGTVNMSVRVSDITVRKEHLRILALNDINNELDEKEIDSWIRLTRVLTHEIMNAVTPITSLSDTLLGLTEAQASKEEIRNGLQTISSTGKGLLSFVESYRKFTRIPTPEPSLFYVKALSSGWSNSPVTSTPMSGSPFIRTSRQATLFYMPMRTWYHKWSSTY